MGTTEDAATMESGGGGGGGVETGAEAASGDVKLWQAPRLRCSEAVRDGLEAENVAAHSVQRRRAILGGCPDAGGGTSTGSRCAQYQAPLPLMALARTCTSASYRFLAAASSATIAPASAGADADADAPSSADMASRGRHVRGYVGLVRLPAAGPAFVSFPLAGRGGARRGNWEAQRPKPTEKKKNKNPKGDTGVRDGASRTRPDALARRGTIFCDFSRPPIATRSCSLVPALLGFGLWRI
uniref:Uncharacterized protein n=1 Tax=Zea mays TaxID=4577 RepID=C4J6N4_MAIZE|nr:unknown [Zea mays]